MKSQIIQRLNRPWYTDEMLDLKVALDGFVQDGGDTAYLIADDFLIMHLSPKSQKRSRLCRK